MAKHIFVTGGVVSSLGKGLTCASIGMLLEHRGLRVRLQKFDPYINVDPGHDEPVPARRGLRPRRRRRDRPRPRPLRAVHQRPADQGLQLHDRQDLPVGHPEGARGEVLRGQDRPGDPPRHRRDQGGRPPAGRPTTSTWSSPRSAARSATSRACRSWRRSASSPLDVGRENCLYIHLTLVPYLKAAGEMKTKPTQHSVGALRQIGIQPDVLICRTEHPISPRTTGQDRPVLQHRTQGGHRGARPGVQHLRGPAEPGQQRARRACWSSGWA